MLELRAMRPQRKDARSVQLEIQKVDMIAKEIFSSDQVMLSS